MLFPVKPLNDAQMSVGGLPTARFISPPCLGTGDRRKVRMQGGGDSLRVTTDIKRINEMILTSPVIQDIEVEHGTNGISLSQNGDNILMSEDQLVQLLIWEIEELKAREAANK